MAVGDTVFGGGGLGGVGGKLSFSEILSCKMPLSKQVYDFEGKPHFGCGPRS